MHFEDVSPRGSAENITLNASVNGGDWFSVTSPYGLGVALTNHAILCYYARTDGNTTYRADGEINCIRIYNRKLTAEELQHNHLIDKTRFDIDELEG